jgi:hypothetical protein
MSRLSGTTRTTLGRTNAAAPARPEPGAGRPGGVFSFRAELDIAEIDTRGRPGLAWTGRANELSRSQLTFRSRRMCYEGRELVVAVHLVDDRPVPLYGMVESSEYDGDGLYRTVVNLLPLPETEAVKTWVAALQHRA